MNTKTYNDVTVKKERNSVILTKPGMTRPLIMARETFRAIVADNAKEAMRGNSEPDNVTLTLDSGIPWD